jgi:hypothetical protein
VEGNALLLTPAAAMPRILTSDQWADYLIYRLYPKQRVFFDGRSDFFGPAIGSDYCKLLAGDGSWRELLGRYRFDLALLPRAWPLASALGSEPGWRKVYEDPVAVLYARDAGRNVLPAAAVQTALPGEAQVEVPAQGRVRLLRPEVRYGRAGQVIPPGGG